MERRVLSSLEIVGLQRSNKCWENGHLESTFFFVCFFLSGFYFENGRMLSNSDDTMGKIGLKWTKVGVCHVLRKTRSRVLFINWE